MKVFIEVIDDNGKKFSGTLDLDKGLQTGSKKEVRQKVVKKTMSLTDHILSLRENGFFKQSQTANEVHGKVNGFYGCEINRVSVALNRLASKKELRKAKKKISDKVYSAYAW